MRNVISILAAAMLLLTAACTAQESESPSPEPTAVPTSSATTASPVPSPTLSPSPVQSFPPVPEGEDAEITAIRKGWEAYETVLDAHLKDPSNTDYSELQVVTVGTETSEAIGDIAHLREKGWVFDGDTIFRDVEISAPVTGPGGVREAEVRYCADPRASRTLDAQTGEVVLDSEDTLTAQVTMQLQPNGTWAASAYASEFRPC